MKILVVSLIVFCFSLILCIVSYAADTGTAASGGYPEYLFLEKVSESEAPGVAWLLALAVETGRSVIFQYLPKINNPEIGDKGFTPEFFEEKLMQALKQQAGEISTSQKKTLEKFLWAAKQSIALNQDRINIKGIGFKYFLPATWARETALMLKTKTGIIIKQAADLYRSPCNKPDELEKKIIDKFKMPGYNGQPYGEMSTMGKQKVYRHFRRISIVQGCLGCHGEPKGQTDVLGYEKDGMKTGDIRGLISVIVPVE